MPRTLFFDTETTDRLQFDAPHTDHRQPDAIQLAAILRDEDGREMSTINFILHTPRRIEPGAEAIHKISKETSDRFGVTQVNGMYVLRDMLCNADIVIAHNIAFDRKVVNAAFFRCDIPEFPWESITQHDTMLAGVNVCRLPKAMGRGFKWPKLSEIYRHFFQEDIDGAHDALVDVRATARVYDELDRIGAFTPVTNGQT